MLFALFIVQAHDIIQHEHDHALEGAKEKGVSHDEESSHFELLDIFSNFHHSGNHLTYQKTITKHLSRTNILKAENIFQYLDIEIIYHSKPIRNCIRDNPDLCSSETSFLFSLRAPPLLIS
jgi:hypothetical protein